MPNALKLLVVVADGEHARFLRLRGDGHLQEVLAFDSSHAHMRNMDLVSDRPGAAMHTGSTAHHALNPAHDPHGLTKERFGAIVAERLAEMDAQEHLDRVVVAVPAHLTHAVDSHLPKTLADKVVARLVKDLVKVPAHALEEHVAPWIRMVHH